MAITKKKKTGLMKKYIKLAGSGGFAKAWKLQKAAKKKAASARKKVIRKKPVKKKVIRKKSVPKKKKVTTKKATKKRVVMFVARKPQKKTPQKRKYTMAKKKAAPKKRKKSVSRKVKPMELVTNAAIGLGGAIGAGIASNMLPIPQPAIKAALPLGLGLAVALSPLGKGKGAQAFAMGAMIMGGIALTKNFAPQIPFIAGEDEMIDYVDRENEQARMLGYEDDEGLYEDDELGGEPFTMGGEPEDIDELEGETFLSTADM